MTIKVAHRKEKSLGLLISEAQCGHFISRDQMPTRYDEMNCRAICKTCNCFDPNHQENFGAALMKILTEEGYDLLWQKSRGLQKYSRFELGEIIDEYKEKLKTLR